MGRKIASPYIGSLTASDATPSSRGSPYTVWPVPSPKATVFAWVPLPERFHNFGSQAFSKKLLSEADVAVAPGLGFGEHGEGFVRIGLAENEQRIRQAVRNIRRFLASALPRPSAAAPQRDG